MPGFVGFTTADEILDFLYRGVAFTIGADLYMRLLVSPSSRAGGGTETNYTGYARYVITRGTSIFGASTGTGSRSKIILIDFAPATSLGNGPFVAWDIVDTSSGAFTKLYNGGPIVPARAVELNKPQRFGIGRLQLSF